MPDWCENSLVLKHKDRTMLEKAIRAWNEGRFLGTLVPEPDYKSNKVRQSFADNAWTSARSDLCADSDHDWLHWRIRNWGTKWEIENDYGEEDVDAESLSVTFLSAWVPPVFAYKSMAREGFEIEAMFLEGSLAFCGSYSSAGFECFMTIDELSRRWIEEHVPREICDEFDILGLVLLHEKWVLKR